MDGDLVMKHVNSFNNKTDQINKDSSVPKELIIQLETELNEQVYQILYKQFPNLVLSPKQYIKTGVTHGYIKQTTRHEESIRIKNDKSVKKKRKFKDDKRLKYLKKPISADENSIEKESVVPLLHHINFKKEHDVDKSTTKYCSEMMHLLDVDLQFMSNAQKTSYYYIHTFDGFIESLTLGKLPCDTNLKEMEPGKYVDSFGFIRWTNGPFWPLDYGPLHPAPNFEYKNSSNMIEPLLNNDQTINQKVAMSKISLKFTGRWETPKIVYNSETFAKNYQATGNGLNCGASLEFESRFESGNLFLARQIDHTEYELVLRNDLHTCGHTQWFYFRLKNMMKGLKYVFKIINLTKKSSLYIQGMQPVMYSEHLASTKGLQWHRSGYNISYSITDKKLFHTNMNRDQTYHTLRWSMEFPEDDDTCYIAHCFPYTYSDLLRDVNDLVKMENNFFKLESLCLTRAKNTCFLITIDDPNFTSIDKRMVVLTARIHPGETNSSFIMKGILEFLTGSSEFAQELRKNFIFKLIPMMNPDGVVVGNYRCSLIGRDLNRNFLNPNKSLFPTVYHLKQVLNKFKEKIILYCDLHGHNQKQNVFMYGCPPNVPSTGFRPENYLKSRIIPWLMSKQSPDKFVFDECYFHVSKSKEATARVVMFRQFNIVNSFTLEASFCGTTISRKRSRQLNMEDFEDIGRSLCKVIKQYHQVINDEEYEQCIVAKLVSDLKRNLSKAVKHKNDIKRQSSSSSFLVGSKTEFQSMTLMDLVKVLHANDVKRGLEQETDSDTESEPEHNNEPVNGMHKVRKKSKNCSTSAHNKKKFEISVEINERLPQLNIISNKSDARRCFSDETKGITGHPKKVQLQIQRPIDRYKDRNNGGIPCFVQERLQERAEKKQSK